MEIKDEKTKDDHIWSKIDWLPGSPSRQEVEGTKMLLTYWCDLFTFCTKKILLSYLGSPYLALAEKSPPSPFNVLRTNCQTSLCGYKFGYVEVKKNKQKKTTYQICQI